MKGLRRGAGHPMDPSLAPLAHLGVTAQQPLADLALARTSRTSAQQRCLTCALHSSPTRHAPARASARSP